jgi:hypothetical protein
VRTRLIGNDKTFFFPFSFGLRGCSVYPFVSVPVVAKYGIAHVK